MIYQEFNLVPGLTVAENILLGIEPQNFGIVRKKEERKRVLEILKKIGAELDPDTICENLTVAEKQLVEIGKAIIRNAKILIMDEPSAALTKKKFSNFIS